jgi:hypothetical protein
MPPLSSVAGSNGGLGREVLTHYGKDRGRSRLIRNTRPREPARAFDDPLELADRALEHLHRIKRGLPGTSPVHPSVEECAELIRMLGWGPQPTRPRPSLLINSRRV